MTDKSDQILTLQDISIDFDAEYMTELCSNPGSLTLTIISMPGGAIQQRHLNHSFGRTWKHYGYLQMLMNVREITVVVKSSIWGDLTRFSLSEHQLMEFCLKQDVERLPMKTKIETAESLKGPRNQTYLLVRVAQSTSQNSTSEQETNLWARCVRYNTALSQSGPTVAILDQTIPEIQQLLCSTPPDSPVRLRTLMLLASATLDRTIRSGNLEDGALNNVESLLDEISNGQVWVLRPEFQAAISQLRTTVHGVRKKAAAASCRLLAEESVKAAEILKTTGDMTHLQAVNKKLSDLMAITPVNDPLRPGIISMLAENLLHCARGQEGYEISYLNDAIDCLEQASPSNPKGLQSQGTVQRTLHAALQLRYALLNRIEDLDRMLTLLPSSTHDPRELLKLGNYLYTRFQLEDGNMSDINRSIDLQKSAIQIALANEPVDGTKSAIHPDCKEATWLSGAYRSLALAFEARFKQSDDLVDLNESLLYFRKALVIPLGPGQDSSINIDIFQRLASSMAYYALNHQESDHLEEIMTLLVDLVSQLPREGPNKSAMSPSLLWMVALTLGSMATSLKNPETLSTLVKKLARPELDLYPGLSTAEVVQAYLDFNLNPSPSTNRKSIPILVKFFRASLASSDNIAVKLGLARILIAQQQWCDPEGDESTSFTNEGVALLKECFNLAPEHDSTFHYFLGRLFGGPGGLDQFERAMVHFARATSDAKLPYERLEAAYEWAEAALKVKSTDCLTAFDVIVETISQVAGLERTVEKRHQLLSGLSSRVLQAAEAALSFDEVSRALEFLERGRGLVWSQLNSLRAPLDELQSRDPALASRLESVSHMLEDAGGQSRTLEEGLSDLMEKRLALQEEESTHLKLSRERDELIKTIRTTIPGFENFLRPLPSSSWLTDLPTNGPVVVLHASTTRCDAIVLVSDQPEPIHLPLLSFSPKKAENLRDGLRFSLSAYHLLGREVMETLDERNTRAIRPAGTSKKRSLAEVLRDILQELWKGVVKPVLDRLEIKRSENTDTRVWWCPTGPLTSLPIHAAGIYDDTKPEESENITDYVVSSYIPTVSLLTERVRNARLVPADKAGICMLSQANAPGFAQIPGTKREINQIAETVDTPLIRTRRLEDEEATQSALLDAMENYSWVHLACHGTQNTEQPLKSGFALADGGLQLATIIKSNLKHAEFAFLSACQTSTGDVKLSEESVHLAAGMLATGYRGVVGTMWSINDRYAPEVANDFYREVLARSGEVDGRKRLDGDKAAYALHHAVRELRKKVGDSSFASWAPYVHFGL